MVMLLSRVNLLCAGPTVPDDYKISYRSCYVDKMLIIILLALFSVCQNMVLDPYQYSHGT